MGRASPIDSWPPPAIPRGSSLPIENVPPGTHAMPGGTARCGVPWFISVGRKSFRMDGVEANAINAEARIAAAPLRKTFIPFLLQAHCNGVDSAVEPVGGLVVRTHRRP